MRCSLAVLRVLTCCAVVLGIWERYGSGIAPKRTTYGVIAGDCRVSEEPPSLRGGTGPALKRGCPATHSAPHNVKGSFEGVEMTASRRRRSRRITNELLHICYGFVTSCYRTVSARRWLIGCRMIGARGLCLVPTGPDHNWVGEGGAGVGPFRCVFFSRVFLTLIISAQDPAAGRAGHRSPRRPPFLPQRTPSLIPHTRYPSTSILCLSFPSNTSLSRPFHSR